MAVDAIAPVKACPGEMVTVKLIGGPAHGKEVSVLSTMSCVTVPDLHVLGGHKYWRRSTPDGVIYAHHSLSTEQAMGMRDA